MLLSADKLWVLALALVLDAIIGDPDTLWRRWPHPVVWFGAVIGWLDKRLNREADSFAIRRLFGVIALCGMLVLFIGASLLLHQALSTVRFGWVAEAVIASVLIAQNSLWRHVMRVAEGLKQGGLEGGRKAVSMIVGRDPNRLDHAGVARAALESLGESTSDGIVAPLFWGVIFGLPGLAVYKVINTMATMPCSGRS